MGAEQVAQAAPARAVPQLEQNFPDAAAPQVGQVAGAGAGEGEDIPKTTWWSVVSDG